MTTTVPLGALRPRAGSAIDTLPEFDYRELAKQALAQDIAALQRQSLAGAAPVSLYEDGWGGAAVCGLAGVSLLLVGALAGLELKRWLICGVVLAGGLQLVRAALRTLWLRHKAFAVVSHKGIWLPDRNTLIHWKQIVQVRTEEQLNMSAGAAAIVSKRIVLSMAAGYQPPRGAGKGPRTRYVAKTKEYVLPYPSRDSDVESAIAVVSRYWQAHATSGAAVAGRGALSD